MTPYGMLLLETNKVLQIYLRMCMWQNAEKCMEDKQNLINWQTFENGSHVARSSHILEKGIGKIALKPFGEQLAILILQLRANGSVSANE